jgi:tryptophan-rich sensory protein
MAIPRDMIDQRAVFSDIKVPGATKMDHMLVPAAGSSSPVKSVTLEKDKSIRILFSPFSFIIDVFWLALFALGSVIEGIIISVTVGIFLSVMFVVGVIAVILQSIALIFVVHIAIGLIIIVLGIVVISILVMSYCAPSEH